MNANFLNYHYYLEAKIPTSIKYYKLKNQNKYKEKIVYTPEPLKVEKYRLSPTPFFRAKSSSKKAHISPYKIKTLPDSKKLSESFNNFLATHALTALSPVEIINHYKIDNQVKILNLSPPRIPNVEVLQINLTKNSTIPEIHKCEFGKIDGELFDAIKKNKKPQIISVNERDDFDFKIVGSMLCLSDRKQLSNQHRRSISSQAKPSKITNFRLESLTYK